MKTLCIDVETTRLPPKNADYKIHYKYFPRIVTLAYKVDDRPAQEFIINQEGLEIPEEVSALHGITTEMANSSPHFIVTVFKDLISLDVPDVVIGHNIYFDSSIIKATVLRLIADGKMSMDDYLCIEQIIHKDRRIDTMKSTIKFCGLPGSKWPKLSELYFKLFGKEFSGAHTSRGDVEATYECYLELVSRGIINLPKMQEV